MGVEEEQVPVYDDQGRKRPFAEFQAEASEAGYSPYEMALMVHQQRSRNARVADESFRAVKTRSIAEYGTGIGDKIDASRTIRWYYEAPNRRDVKDIDTVRDEYKKKRVRRVRESFEEGGIISGVIDVRYDEMGDAIGRFVPRGHAEQRGEGNEVHMMKSGVERSSTLAHELGHALDLQLEGDAVHRYSRGKGYSAAASEDETFARQIRGQSEQRRGKFREDDEYRSQATEQFADWFVSATETPRHTRATAGKPWRAFEERASEKVGERVEELADLPRMASKRSVRDAVDEITSEREDWDYSSDESNEVYGLVRETYGTIRKRYETEGHRERVESRVRDLEDDLEGFRASNVADFSQLPVGDVWVDDNPLFEGARKSDLIPEEPIRELEDMLGTKLDIPGL